MVKLRHYKDDISPKTACGWYVESRPGLRITEDKRKVTCKRRLLSLRKWRKRQKARSPIEYKYKTFVCLKCGIRTASTLTSEKKNVCKECYMEG